METRKSKVFSKPSDFRINFCTRKNLHLRYLAGLKKLNKENSCDDTQGIYCKHLKLEFVTFSNDYFQDGLSRIWQYNIVDELFLDETYDRTFLHVGFNVSQTQQQMQLILADDFYLYYDSLTKQRETIFLQYFDAIVFLST